MSNFPADPDLEIQSNQDSSFGDILSQYEQSHARQPGEEKQGREAVVIAVSGDNVYLNIGRKTEGLIPTAELLDASGTVAVKPGDKLLVSIKGRDAEGYYLLSTIRVERPKDWSSLEKAYSEKAPIAGTVTELIKGGLAVDIGVRAFMPASRSGAKDPSEVEKLVGQEITCRIIELDVGKEDVVVDRRVVLEEEEARSKEQRFSELREGQVARGTVRSVTDYGAFVDIGGIDGLLHVAEMSWGRVNKPSDLLNVGDEVDVQILKVDARKRRVSLGMKQLQPHPWAGVEEKYHTGDRVRGVVTRTTEFGAFVELEPGVEGLIHLSEMSWSKRVRKAEDVVKTGEVVEVVVLGVNPAEKRISLGLKQALGDPWADAEQQYRPGTVVEGQVTSLQKFGAFVQVSEGVEGMIHVGDLTSEKRINHPQELLKMGQTVRAVVLEVDKGRRRLRLGIKQLQPTSLDEYIAEHKEGDVVTGRIFDVSRSRAKVELGEGVNATCTINASEEAQEAGANQSRADLESLTSMLSSKWKGGGATGNDRREQARSGQIRSFRIIRLDPAEKKIEIELVS